MIAWPVALVLGLILILFGTIVLSFAVYIEALLVIRLYLSIRYLSGVWMTIMVAVVAGSLAYMFGRGAYLLTSSVVDGMIGRFWT